MVGLLGRSLLLPLQAPAETILPHHLKVTSTPWLTVTIIAVDRVVYLKD